MLFSVYGFECCQTAGLGVLRPVTVGVTNGRSRLHDFGDDRLAAHLG